MPRRLYLRPWRLIFAILLLLAGRPAAAEGSFQLDVGSIAFAGQVLSDVHLACSALQRHGNDLSCDNGTIGARGQRWPARYKLRNGGRLIELEFPAPRGTAAERWQLRRLRNGGSELTLHNVRLARLVALLPPLDGLAHLAPDGRLAGRITISAHGIDGRLQLSNGRFADASGTQAGEGMAATLAFTLQPRGKGGTGTVALDWLGGELYLAPIYLAGGGFQLKMAGNYADGALDLQSMQLRLPGGSTLSGKATWTPGQMWPLHAEATADNLDLGVLGEHLLKPLLAARALPAVTLAGQARLHLVWRDGAPQQMAAMLRDAGLTLGDGHLTLRGLNGELDWSASALRKGELRVVGGSIGRLPFAAFALPLQLRPDGIDLAQASIPLLDGKLLLDDWQLRRPAIAGGDWQWSIGLALTPLSLPALTQALGLPTLAGTLSFSLPRVRHADGVLALDGAAVIQAFDGYLNATGLRLTDPFGPLPRLSGDLEVRHIDLGMLTDTYSFGHITGFVDGDVRGLEMAGLQPLAFDARIASSPGSYERRISQRAVQNITALGGDGGAAALQRTALRFFEDFGYERIGLTCRLAGEVCTLDGIVPTADGRGFLIVQGGGIPALSIVGYNRRVDWPVFVERLRGAVRNNLKAEIR